MIRARLWQEHTHRSITTSEGPFVVPPGKFVLVAVCDTLEELARVVEVMGVEKREEATKL